jgi:peptide/nickel transport system substrate-binding protein
METYRRFPSIAWTVLVVTAMLTSSTALISFPVDDATASSETTLRIGFQDKLDSLNPNVGMTQAAHAFYSLVYDGLFRVDEDMEIIGDLAVDWRVDADFEPFGSVWRYNLTRNAKWHDGTFLTADDVVFTVNLNANNYTQMWDWQPYAYYIDYAEKVDDYGVRIHFYDRVSDTPLPVSFGDTLLIPILPEHMLGDHTAAEIGFEWEGVFEDSDPPVVGTGPFMATSQIYSDWLSGHEITLLRNPDYHGSVDWGSEISYDSLKILCYKDPLAMEDALVDDTIDIAKFDAAELSSWRETLDENIIEVLEIAEVPSCVQHVKALDFDLRPSIGNPIRFDPAVRQAMAMAINRSTIVSSPDMLNGCAKEGTGFISSANSEWHCEFSDVELLGQDIDEANALLEAAGYRFTPESPDIRVATADSWAVQDGLVEEGANLTFDLAFETSPAENRAIVEYIKGEWSQIGIEARLRAGVDEALPACPMFYYYEIMIWDFWGRPPDPHATLFTQSKAAWNGWNDNYYYNPDYELHYNASISALDDEVRKEHVSECQRIHYDDIAYIVLAEVNGAFVWRTDSFVGWGDWGEHPGRSMDNIWGASALYFDLEPIDDDPGAGMIGVIALGIAATIIVGIAVVVLRRAR